MVSFNETCAVSAANLHDAAAGQHNCCKFRRRIGMRQATADRAAVSHLVVGDVTDSVVEKGVAVRNIGMSLNVAPPHTGAYSNTCCINSNRFQLIDAAT